MFKKVMFILMALLLIVPFVYAGERVVTVGGNSATRPITDFGINLTTAYYVDSVNGDDGRRGLSKETAVATWDYAVSLTTANQGDIIYLMPNSDEEIDGAGAVTMDSAGVRVIGLGSGADRPTFTFSDTASTILFTAASTSIENVLLVPSVDNVASAIVVSAADVSLDIEVRDKSATVEFIRAILTTAAADNLTIKLKYRGFIAGTAGVTPIQLVGVDTARIYVDYYGEASTAVVNFITTACLDIQITGIFWNDNTALTKNVIDTEGNGEWLVQGWDGKGGYHFTGSDAIALAAGGNTTVDAILVDTATTIPATITVIDVFHDVGTADAVTNVVMSDVIGNKEDTAAAAGVSTTESLMAYAKQIVTAEIAAAAALVILDEFQDVPGVDNVLNAQINEVIGNKTDAAAAAAVTTTDTLVGYTKQIVTAEIAEAAATVVIDAYHDVGTADAVTNVVMSDVTGNKTDAAAAGAVSAVESLMAYAKQNVTNTEAIPKMVIKAYADLTGYDNAVAFTVTGDVLVRIVGVVGATAITSSSGTTDINVGTTEAPAVILAATTVDNSDFGITDVWVTSSSTVDIAIMATETWFVVGGGADISLFRNVDDLSAGALTLYCWWKPLSTDGDVTAP